MMKWSAAKKIINKNSGVVKELDKNKEEYKIIKSGIEKNLFENLKDSLIDAKKFYAKEIKLKTQAFDAKPKQKIYH